MRGDFLHHESRAIFASAAGRARELHPGRGIPLFESAAGIA
jgi:hypothetical protein